MINETFVPLDVAPLGGAGSEPGFSGAVSSREVGRLRVARVRASPMVATRTKRHIEASREDDYFLALHLLGSAQATQDGRSVALGAGDFALFDSTRPYAIEFHHPRAFEHLIYRIPRSELDARCPGLARATAVRVPIASDEGRLAASYLCTLARTSQPMRPTSEERLSATALDLLATALGAAAGLDADPESDRRRCMAQLKQYALARVGDPELSPETVARAAFVSVRQLHRLFEEEEMTFGAFVREERLRRCHRDLADPRLAWMSVAEIARRSGYRSAAHFTRAFTARYGVRPRDVRRSGGDSLAS
jgi:AraC-like DNA-binding protein